MRSKQVGFFVFFILLLISAHLAAPAAAAQNQSAPGAPGALPTWTSGSKEGVGTSTSTDSHVWFTLQGGILSEVYYPLLDTADVRTLEFAISDGKSVWLESKDMQHAIERVSEDSLVYRQTSRDGAGRFTISKTYATDPARDTLLMDVAFSAPRGFDLYVLYDPALKNPGMGDTGYAQGDALVAEKPGVASALLCDNGLQQMSSGFAGVSDGYTDLLLHRRLEWSYARAENGNVVEVAKISGARFTLALGFGADSAAAIESAQASLKTGFAAVSSEYVEGWKQYVQTL